MSLSMYSSQFILYSVLTWLLRFDAISSFVLLARWLVNVDLCARTSASAPINMGFEEGTILVERDSIKK